MIRSNLVSIESSVATFEITVDSDTLMSQVNSAIRKIANRVNVPGFRRGKAPRAVLERYVSREAIYEEALKSIVPAAYKQALDESKVKPIDDPEFSGLEDPELENGEPLVFKATVPVFPEIVLGDYESMKLEKTVREVTDEDVDRYIEELRRTRLEYIPVDRDVADHGDLVTMDFQGFTVGDEGRTPIDGASGTDFNHVIGSGTLIPEFEEKIVGLKKNAEATIDVTFPEDYHAPELAGKSTVFDVKITEIKAQSLPELNDEFAKDAANAESVEDLKAKVKHGLTHRAVDEAKRNLGMKALSQLVDMTHFDVPDLMVRDRTADMTEELKRRLSGQGLTWEDYLESRGKTEDDVIADMMPEAERSVRMDLVAQALLKKEDIKVTSADVERALMSVIGMKSITNIKVFERMREDPEARQTMARTVAREKAMAILASKCDANPEPECDECKHDHDHDGCDCAHEHDHDHADEPKA